MQRRAFICGLSGLALTAGEREFLASTRPAGIVLFARNVESPDQLRSLIAEVRAAVSPEEDMLICVDQEGGRVQRLTVPHWPRYPAASAFGRIYRSGPAQALQAAHHCARLMAADLQELGINTSFAPVLDIPVPGSDNVIGDRAYSDEADAVIALGRTVAQGLIAGGVLPVMKHIPGHGRAMADSHLALPVVEAPLRELQATDFNTFRALRHLPMAMTAHVVFTAVDPHAPVTISKKTVEEVVRTDIGFGGLLLTDDLSMRALSGSFEERTAASFAAGCDLVLHCNGRMDEMAAVAKASPVLAGAPLRRFEAALARLGEPETFDRGAAEAARREILATVA